MLVPFDSGNACFKRFLDGAVHESRAARIQIGSALHRVPRGMRAHIQDTLDRLRLGAGRSAG